MLIDFLKKIGIFYYILFPKLFGIGYTQYKISIIKKLIKKKNINLTHYLDERIVEIPWVINNLNKIKDKKILDAGCTLNFYYLIKDIIKNNNLLTFVNLYPEKFKFKSESVKYLNKNILDMGFSNDYFDIITCISVLEHIGFDNSAYNDKGNSRDIFGNNLYKNALLELYRILKPGGSMYLTVPFGKKMIFKNYQQFSYNEIKIIKDIFKQSLFGINFYKFSKNSWIRVEYLDCLNSEAIYKENIGISSTSIALLEIKKI